MGLLLAASVAALASGVGAVLSADEGSVLTYNWTVPLSSGLFEWDPAGEFGPVAPGQVIWESSYPLTNQPYSSALVAEGPAVFTSSSQNYLGTTPGMIMNTAAEAVYYDAEFTPWNSTNPDMLRVWIGDDDDGHVNSAPGYVRYYNGVPKFTSTMFAFGIDPSIRGGGNFTIRNVTMTMSMVTKAPSYEEAFADSNTRTIYNQPAGDLDPAVKCKEVNQNMDQTPKGEGYGYFNVGWDITTHPNAYCEITMPANTSLFHLLGTRGYSYGEAVLEWNPPLPELLDAGTYINSHAKWLRHDELLAVQVLDPRVRYVATVKTRPGYKIPDQGGQKIGISSLRTFSAIHNGQAPTFDGTSATGQTVKKASSNMGAIIGGAVGGVLGALCIAALAIWLWVQHRRKHNVHAVQNHKTEFDIDDPNVTPYVNSHRSTFRSADDDNQTMSEVPSSPRYARSRAGTATADSASQVWSDEGLLSPSTAAGFGVMSGASSGKSAAAAPSASRGGSRSRREVVNEQDAGTLEPIEDQVEYEYVPPLYNPEWAQTSASGRSNASSAGPYSPTNRSTMGASSSGMMGEVGDYEMSTMSTPMITPMVEEPNPMSPVNPGPASPADTEFHEWYNAQNSSTMISPTTPHSQTFGNR